VIAKNSIKSRSFDFGITLAVGLALAAGASEEATTAGLARGTAVLAGAQETVRKASTKEIKATLKRTRIA
jgi:hypothetical protein